MWFYRLSPLPLTLMRFSDILTLARNAMKSNRLRTNLTVAIIAIGITALIGIVTVIEVLKGSIHSNFSGMGSNTFTITAESMVRRGGGKHGGKRKRVNTENNRITLQEATWFENNYQYPAIVSASILATNTATLRHNQEKTNPNIMVMGCDENYVKLSETNFAAGRNFNKNEARSGESNCLLGYALGEQLFAEVSNAVGNTVIINDERYRILGVLESKGSSMVNRTDNMVFVSLQNARQRYNINQKSAVLSVAVNDVKHLDLAMDEAEGVMRAVRRLSVRDERNFSLNKNDEIANNLIKNLRFVTLAASIIGFITLLGAAIGLMNIMLVAVAERTREIGISKAIGANNQTVKRQFLLEAIYISLKGGIIGIIIGILLGNLLSIFFESPFLIPWLWIATGISICVFVGMAAGIYPAIRAAKLNPITALRYE
jgi:putative ABC transport system permease protein